jgi:CRP-like cAMP-binding protein
MTFFRPDEEITQVYFIEQGCTSLINILPDGDAVEVGTIGNEGLVGTPVLMESDKMPLQCDMEIPGHGWQMPAQALKAAVRQSDTLRIKLLRFAQGHFNQVAQTAACNRLHTIEERCARWLLMTRDRVGDEFPLNRLHQKGFISNPVGKTKSVILTEEGERKARRLFQEPFAKRP